MEKKRTGKKPGKDYHLHTRLCKHASGSLEEYTESAISKGITEICFADHIPLPNGFDQHHRMELRELEIYLQLIESCQKKFPEIKILSGIEADYIEGMEPYLQDIISSYPFDLVIMSIHFIRDWPEGQWVFNYHFPEKSLSQVYQEYFVTMIKGIRTGLFDIVGHLDLIKRPDYPVLKVNPDGVESVLKAIQEKNMGIELNTSGIRKDIGDYYPSLDLIHLIIEKGIPVTPGSDAHSPEQVGFHFTELLDALPDNRKLKWAGYEKRKIYLG